MSFAITFVGVMLLIIGLLFSYATTKGKGDIVDNLEKEANRKLNNGELDKVNNFLRKLQKYALIAMIVGFSLLVAHIFS